MKRVLTFFLTIVVCISCSACLGGNRFIQSNSLFENNDYTAMSPEVDTMYPDDVAQTGSAAITAEMAEKDLRANKVHECLNVGTVVFDNLTYEYPDFESIDAIFWFDISVPYEYGNENYRAKVKYRKHDGLNNGEYILMTKDMDIWQVESTFTKMGRWTYDDGETYINVNFIKTEELGYIVEYEITYYASYWVGSEWVKCSSDGEKKVFGDNEWDGNVNYLSIDLKDSYDESGQTIDHGYIKVYPWDGVYWDALHAKGGPFKLSNSN